MSRTRVISLGVLVALIGMTAQAQQAPNPTTPAQVPAPAPGPWTKAYVQLVGRMAYVWGWPLAVQINQRATHAGVSEPMMVNGVGGTSEPTRNVARLRRSERAVSGRP